MEATITKALEKPKPCITDSVSQYGVAINTCKYIYNMVPVDLKTDISMKKNQKERKL